MSKSIQPSEIEVNLQFRPEAKLFSSLCLAILISSANLPCALANLPMVFPDPTGEDAPKKQKAVEKSSLFAVPSTTVERMEARTKISFLSEKISQAQERTLIIPDLDLTKLPKEKRELVERALAATQARRLAALLNQRGTYLAVIGDNSKALGDLDEAVTTDAGYAPAYNNRAWMRALEGDLQSALKDVNKAIELAPDMAEAYDTRGTINLAMHKLDEAMVDFTDSITKKPAYAEAYFHRALAHKAMGHKSQFVLDERRAKELGYPAKNGGEGDKASSEKPKASDAPAGTEKMDVEAGPSTPESNGSDAPEAKPDPNLAP